MRTSYAVFYGSLIPWSVAFFILKKSEELLYRRKSTLSGMPSRPSLQAACNKSLLSYESRRWMHSPVVYHLMPAFWALTNIYTIEQEH